MRNIITKIVAIIVRVNVELSAFIAGYCFYTHHWVFGVMYALFGLFKAWVGTMELDGSVLKERLFEYDQKVTKTRVIIHVIVTAMISSKVSSWFDLVKNYIFISMENIAENVTWFIANSIYTVSEEELEEKNISVDDIYENLFDSFSSGSTIEEAKENLGNFLDEDIEFDDDNFED